MIRIVVPGPPPRKNARGTIANGRRITPKKTREWVARFDEAWLDQIRRKPPEKLAKRGRWTVEIDIYEDKLRHLDVDVPFGDWDSSISTICDALQVKPKVPATRWRPLDDDARIVRGVVEKHYSAENPRVQIVLIPLKETT